MFKLTVVLIASMIIPATCNQNQSDTQTSMVSENNKTVDSCDIALTADNDIEKNS